MDIKKSIGDLFSDKVSITILGIAIVALIPILSSILYFSYSFSYGNSIVKPIAILATSIMIALASFAGGIFLGFIFGIPKPNEHNSTEENTSHQEVNTNLVQISDWLTKILVGVSLTQLNQIPTALYNLSGYLEPALGGKTGGIYGIILMIFFIISGFLVSYIFTRTYITEMFEVFMRMNKRLLEFKEGIQQEVKVDIQKQSDADAKALSLVNRKLSDSDSTDIKNQDLIDAVMQSSRQTQVNIYYMAKTTRSKTWQDNKELMEKTIPIFQALIACDKDEQFHENYGQLGFALKDKTESDWKGALDALNKAIEIRAKHNKTDWLLYEFNRAICMIKLESAPTKEIQDKIVLDLRKAYINSVIKPKIDNESVIQEWLKSNKITL